MLLFLRRIADYGGIASAVLCGIHCAAGPLLLTWWGSHQAPALAARGELVFLGASALLVGLATWQHSSGRLRLALWASLALFAAASLLAGRWPWLEAIQYLASAGLIGAHLLNHRHCRC